MREVQGATAGASTSTAPAARSGGVLFVHRFGAALNAHVHLHVCVLDGVVAQGRWALVFCGAAALRARYTTGDSQVPAIQSRVLKAATKMHEPLRISGTACLLSLRVSLM